MKSTCVLLPALMACLALAGRAPASQFPVEASPLWLARPLPPEAPVYLAQIGRRPTDGQDTKEAEKEKTGPSAEVINPKLAMVYSLVLPGLGQQLAGRKERARVFYALEAGIWSTFVLFRLQGDARKDRYIEFAEFTAGVDASGKDDAYWRTIAQFERSDPGPLSANEFVRRQARAQFPDDIEAQRRYLEENGYFGSRAWDWQGPDNLARYRDLRGRSLDAYDRSEFSIAAAIANRLLSMIDAARVASAANRARAEGNAGLEPRRSNEFGLKLMRDGNDRVPVLTYTMTF